jgi:hypothetical protein
MPQQTINIGAAPDDGTGDTLRVGGDKINDNFTELYAADAALGTAAALDVDTDDTLAADSDSLIPTQQAVKAYVDAAVGGPAITELDDIPDVNAPTPSNGDVLTWDSTPGEWVPQAPSAGIAELDDVPDVNAPSPSNGDVLTWDSTPGEWIPMAPTSGVGAEWTLVDQSGAPAGGASTWTWSTNVTEVDVVGLGAYNELILMAVGVSAASSGNRMFLASVNNGSSFYTGSGDYVAIGPTGASTADVNLATHTTPATAARTVLAQVVNMKGAVKFVTINQTGFTQKLFVASASDINAIRLTNSAGGNLLAGSLYVFAR